MTALPTTAPDAPATRRARREAARRQAGWRARARALRSAGRTVVERTRMVWGPVATGLRWVSPLGWAVLALGVLSWYVGVRFGWVELLVVAAACGILVLACVALTIGRVHVDIHSEVDPRRVTVGDPATGRIVVRNLARTPLLPLLVELPVGVTAARFVMPPLGGRAEHEELFVVPTHRRGVIAVGPARTVRGDPLGVLRRTVEFADVEELFVHPRTAHLETLGAGLLRDLEGTVTEDHSMSDLAFHALREYQPGDDRRYIHWRSSAKAGRLLVRQFLDTRRSHVTVLVDTDPRSFTGGEEILDDWTGQHTEPLVAAHSAPEIPDLETAISVGASIVLRVIRDEQDTTIVCGSHDISRSTPQLTLDTLARVEPAPVDLTTLALRAVDLAGDTSILFVVTGPRRPFVQLQRAGAQFGPEVRNVAVVVDPDSLPGIRRGGGLTILTVARLADLRRVVAAGVAA
jgi:uncharacterized protein (DUF58 family)